MQKICHPFFPFIVDASSNIEVCAEGKDETRSRRQGGAGCASGSNVLQPEHLILICLVRLGVLPWGSKSCLNSFSRGFENGTSQDLGLCIGFVVLFVDGGGVVGLQAYLFNFNFNFNPT
jgi:hypothetical protein